MSANIFNTLFGNGSASYPLINSLLRKDAPSRGIKFANKPRLWDFNTVFPPFFFVHPLPQADLPKELGMLRTAAQHNHANVGVYAAVLKGGTIRRGDQVRLE